MKQFAYAQKNENDIQLFLFEKAEPIQAHYPYEALMMSRVDFDIKVTEVPPVPESEMGNLLTYKLRSLYPGDPESTVFDYKILQKNKQRFAVIFISNKDTIEGYKKIADKKPLFLSFPITNALMQKYDDEDCIFLGRYFGLRKGSFYFVVRNPARKRGFPRFSQDEKHASKKFQGL
jgi:hypothetical protein